MVGLIKQSWVQAEYWVWAQTSANDGNIWEGDKQTAAYCWGVSSCCRERIAGGWNPAHPSIHADHTAVVLPAVRAAFEAIPEGGTVHVFSNAEWFTRILDGGVDARVASGYMRKDKKPLKHADDWKLLDAIINVRALRVSASPPPYSDDPDSLEYYLYRVFEDTREGASLAAKNIGRAPGDWGI